MNINILRPLLATEIILSALLSGCKFGTKPVEANDALNCSNSGTPLEGHNPFGYIPGAWNIFYVQQNDPTKILGIDLPRAITDESGDYDIYHVTYTPVDKDMRANGEWELMSPTKETLTSENHPQTKPVINSSEPEEQVMCVVMDENGNYSAKILYYYWLTKWYKSNQ